MNLSETMPRFGEDISSKFITISFCQIIKLNDYNKNGSIRQTKSRPPLPAPASEKKKAAVTAIGRQLPNLIH